jgi:ribosomal protein S18 acetylase RimI-like enzyme
MQPDIAIRETTREDFHRVLRFIELVDGDFYPPLSKRGDGGISERVRTSLATSNANYVVAQITEPEPSDDLHGFVSMVGFTRMWQQEDDAYINFLATHPSYRKRGIAHLLYSRLEEILFEKGVNRIYLCTWSDNLEAIRLYEKLGYMAYSIVLNDRGNGINTLNYRKGLDREFLTSAKQ